MPSTTPNRTISCVFTFEAAHRLPKVPAGHKCARLHGHSFRAEVFVEGPLDECGFVVDFDVIREAWAPLHAQLDHNFLNEVPGLENPTSEILAEWIFVRMAQSLVGASVSRVIVGETCRSSALFP